MVPRHVVRAIVALALAGSGLLVLATPCLACSCAPSTPRESFRRADAAFIGRVVNDVMTADGTIQTFEVDEVFAGKLGPTVDVWAQIGTEVVNSCAVLFPEGDTVAVLLFLDGQGRWTAQACSPVTPAELRQVGGRPREPIATITPAVAPSAAPAADLDPAEAGGLPAWAIVGLGAFLALAAVGAQAGWSSRLEHRRERFGSLADVEDAARGASRAARDEVRGDALR